MSGARLDEELEAYYLDAKEKLFAGDFQEAVDGFERALEVNPKNAAAHLELGLIYYEHLQNYVSAIYHFKKMLDLRPDHMMAGQIRDHVKRCEMDFASSANLGPLNQNTETRMKKLVQLKDSLTSKVKTLEGQLSQMREVLSVQRDALIKSRIPVDDSSQPDPPSASPEPSGGRLEASAGSHRNAGRLVNETASPSSRRVRKHVVRSNDNFYALSRHYGVGLKVIEAANPGVNSRKLSIGQVINVPYPTATASR